ncbi:MAG: peptidoglycan DD-metalloendopeptidase family protein, partial [Bowdeniella nasicola]|nr:peptidoglycan DD-metalloendopeptidase family protein [Bowdeniella nasicola]
EQERLREEITEVTHEIGENRDSLAEVVRTSYRSGGASLGSLTELYEIGVGEDTVQELAAREAAVRTQTRVLTQLADLQSQVRNATARQETVTELITDLKEQADEAVAAAESARQQKEAKAVEIAALESDQEELAGQLASRKGEIEKQRAQVDAADSELRDEIAKIVAEEERKRREAAARQPKPARPGRPAPPPAAPAPAPAPGKHAIEPPVPRPLYVTSPWGYRVYPITGGWFMHNGVDLASACGNPQHAAAGGTVTATKWAATNGTHGNQVIINHGTINGAVYVTVYNHLSRFAVSAGQRVSQGQLIGYTGATGLVTGCHVHFEVWRNGTTIDPMGLPGF